MKTQRILAVAVVLVMMLSLFPAGTTSAASPVNGSRVDVTLRGTTVFKALPSGAEDIQPGNPVAQRNQYTLGVERDLPRGGALMASPMTHPLNIPVVSPSPVVDSSGRVAGWNALSHYDSRTANGGNQFSLEPPDQGLCVGGGYVMEAVNTVLTVYDTKGNMKKGIMDLNTFFGLPAAIDRTNLVYGPFIGDPRCLYDPWTHRWFVSVFELETDPATGDFTGPSHVLFAVSATGNPTGAWNIYDLNTTDGDGTVPGHPGCPCFADQPLIGFNTDAFIISTNEYSTLGTEFNGAQVYAIPKLALARGKPTFAIHFDQLSLEEGPAYSLQPAIPGSPLAVSPQAGGTQFFLSALDFNATLDNRIAVWALTGTRSLYTRSPRLTLSYSILHSETYGQPPVVTQKPGPYPLGESLGEPLNKLNTNDDRMNQVYFSNNMLYSGLNTIVCVKGQIHAGIAFFVVKPGVLQGRAVGRMYRQGYVAVTGNDVMFPAVAANQKGDAIMTYTLAGPDYYPSAAYTKLAYRTTVNIARPGVLPADGFTGYVAFGGNGVERWGDYSAAVTDGVNIWMATEYIPDIPRTTLANWGTFIFKVKP